METEEIEKTAPKKKEMNFEDTVDNYVNTLKAQLNSVPVIMGALLSYCYANANKVSTFISEYGIKITENEQTKNENTEEEKKEKNYIPTDKQIAFCKISKNVNNAFAALDLYPKNIVVSLTCVYDAFLGNLIRLIYQFRPGLLNSCEKKFSFSDIAKYESIEKMKEKIIEKEVESVLRESHIEHFSWLSKKLEVNLTNDLPSFKDFIEISERRNLFVHTGGVVSEQYIDVCKKHGCNIDVTVGTKLDADRNYVKHTFCVLFEIGIKLSQVIWRIIDDKNGIRDADKYLNGVTYDLLNEGKFQLAKNLLEFSTKPYVKHKDQIIEYMHKINKALCFYMMGNKDECISELDKIDFSAVDVQFKLANLVLREKYDSAIQYMEPFSRIPEYGPEVYDEWPLFREFVKQECFLTEYKRIYKKDFESVDCNPAKWEDSVQSAMQIIKEYKEKTGKDPSAKDDPVKE